MENCWSVILEEPGRGEIQGTNVEVVGTGHFIYSKRKDCRKNRYRG